VVLCDEITSALDVSVQAFHPRAARRAAPASGLAMIFVTHDLGVLRAVADRAWCSSGRVRETGVVSQLLEAPRHAYTATLVRSIPDPAAHHAEQHPEAAMRRVFHADYVGDLGPMDYERARLATAGAELAAAAAPPGGARRQGRRGAGGVAGVDA